MAFKMRSGNKPAFKQMGSSPLKIAPVVAAGGTIAARTAAGKLIKKGGQKLLQKAAKNKKVQQKLIKPAKNQLAKLKNTKVGKTIDITSKQIKKKKQSLLDKGKEFIGKHKNKLLGAAAVAPLLGAGSKEVEPKNKPSSKPSKSDNLKVNKDMSVDLKTGVVKSKKQTAAKNKIEANRKTKPGEKVKGGTKTWSEGMKASGGNLNKLVAQRKNLKKGTPEYNAVQNKINAALGSKKRHGVQTTTKTAGPKVSKDIKRTTKTKVTTPGLGSKETKVVKGTKDNVRKIKTKDRNESGDVTKKTKVKFDVKGSRKKKKVVTKTNDTVTKLKIKDRKDEPAKVKTRKRGGTGIGSAIKSKLADRKARRAKRKANR